MKKTAKLCLWLVMLFALLLLALPAAADGELAELDIALVSEEVTRGEFLDIQILNLDDYKPYTQEEDYQISARVVGEDIWYQCNRWGTIHVPTQNLNPENLAEEDEGRFTVEVSAYYANIGEVYATARFEVVEPGDGELIFSISETEAITGADYILSVYAKGAGKIEIYDSYDDLKWSQYSDEYKVNDGYGFRGIFSYYAKAYYYDDYGYLDYVKYSETLSVNITAPYGDVTPARLQAPSVLQYGDTLTILLDDSSNYTSWDLNIRRTIDDSGVTDGNSVYHTWGNTPTNKITVPSWAWNKEPGECYSISLCLFRRGYHGYGYGDPVLIVGDGTIADSVSVTVNGQTGTLELAAHQPMTVHVVGPEDATALMVYEGFRWQFYEGNERTSDWGWWTMNIIHEFPFFAKYTTDPIPDHEFDWYSLNWSDTVSNVVTVKNMTQGYLPKPEFELVSDTVTRGDWVEAKITNLDDYAGFQNVSFAAYVSYEPTGQWYGQGGVWDGGDTVRFATATLNSENRLEPFTLEVKVSASVGWYETITKASFTVVEPEEATPVFSVSPSTILTLESFRFNLYAPRAAEYRMMDGDNLLFSSSGGVCVYGWSDWEPIIRHLRALVRYPDSEDWVEVGTAEVNVTAPYGSLPGVLLSAPGVLNAGEDLTVSFTGPEQLDDVDLIVTRLRDGQRVWHSWGQESSITAFAVQPSEDYNIQQLQQPGEPVLEAGEVYDFSLSLSKRGYVGQIVSGRVLVVGPDTVAPAITVTVDGEAESLTLPVYRDVDVQVKAPEEATAVRVWNGYEDLFTRTEDMHISTCWTDTQEHALYAFYTTEPIPDGEVNWNQLSWQGVSNIVTIQPTALDSIPAPEISLDKAELAYGEYLKIQITNLEDYPDIPGLSFAAVPCYEPWNQQCGSWVEWDGVDSIMLNTGRINLSGQTGDFTVRVQIFGAEGYLRGESKAAFRFNGELGPVFWDDVYETWADRYMAPVEGEDLHATRVTTTPIAIAFTVDNYDELVDAYGLTPSWSLEYVGGPTFDCELVPTSYGDGMVYEGVHVLSSPEEAGISEYRAFCTWGGHTTSVLLRFRYVSTPLPEPAEIPNVLLLARGETRSFSLEPKVSNGFSLYSAYVSAAPGIDVTAQDGTLTVTAAEPGLYYATVEEVFLKNNSTNIRGVHELAILVTEDGTVRELILPAALALIDEEAFAGTGAQLVRVPDGCTEIGSRAFGDCNSLRLVYLPSSVSKLGENVFSGSEVCIVTTGADTAALCRAQGVNCKLVD